MPGVPPINPQLLMALAQKFGGIAPAINPSIRTPGINPNARTPPGYGGGGMAQRGEVLGRPTMPTPGAPRTMPPSLGETLGTVTPKPAAQRGAKTTYDPDGGYVEEDNDGTKRVFDKDNKLIDTIIPPGSPGAGTWQPPVEAKKPGIWDRLTDPSLAGIALAAGQQMTRARYPGESGIGNAVNAVTAGYNTLAQQRQMQYARELAEREWQAKQAKAQQEKLESEAKVGDYKSQGERRKAQTEDEARKAKAASQKASVDEMMDVAKHNLEKQKAETDQQRVTNTKAYNDDILRQGDSRINIAERQAMTAADTLKELRKRNAGLDEIRAAELVVKQRQVAVDEARENRQRLEETSNIEKFIAPARMLVDMEDEANQKYYEAGGQRPVGPPKSVEQRTIEKATELKRGTDAAKGKVTTAAPSTQAAPAAAPQQGGPTVLRHPQTGQRIVLDGKTNQWVDAATGRPVSQ